MLYFLLCQRYWFEKLSMLSIFLKKEEKFIGRRLLKEITFLKEPDAA